MALRTHEESRDLCSTSPVQKAQTLETRNASFNAAESYSHHNYAMECQVDDSSDLFVTASRHTYAISRVATNQIRQINAIT